MNEALTLAGLYLDTDDWLFVQKTALRDNLFQSRTLTTLKKLCNVNISRLKMLQKNELEFMLSCCRQEQAYMLWIAICRRYSFIAEFAVEVLRENFFTGKPDLTFDDFEMFFSRKSQWHPELDAIRSSTKKKLRQVLFRILREADLITKDNKIQPALLSPEFIRIIRQGNAGEFAYFPLF